MTGARTGVCEWCGERFEARSGRGPVGRYCRPSHRQRAWEARRASRWPAATSPSDADHARALDEANSSVPQSKRKVTPRRPSGREAIVGSLVSAATEEFAAVGFRGASIRSIAGRANVNHGMISRYFGSKGQLLHAALSALAEENAKHLRANDDFDAYVSRRSFQLETQIVGRLILEGVEPTLLPTSLPVYDLLGPAIAGRYGLSAEEGRIAVAARSALTLGWALFGSWIGSASGLSHDGQQRLQASIGEQIRRLGVETGDC
ncbi:TetR/AcrR family transcriptional regulator [Mycolicibacterium sp. P1-18]|uniref:TetR/AcrR family transcriptional regulator n=1 Tax=Mycolicibacterium sp. P1-18 TaxID=2024615 RepID=UPI0018DA0573|nr:TetR/AcrR family transcriptional regulator [Mycolicibacterium sp. P1-18]